MACATCVTVCHREWAIRDRSPRSVDRENRSFPVAPTLGQPLKVASEFQLPFLPGYSTSSAMLLVIKFRLIICKFLWARQFYLSVRPSSVCLYIASFANLFPFRSCVGPFPDVCSPPIRRLLVLVSSFSSPKTTASSLSLPPFLHPSLHSFKCPIPFIALSTRDIECERSAGEGDDDDDDGKSAVDTNCSSISSRVRLLSRKQILSIRQSVGLNLSRTIDLRPIVGLRPRDRSVRGSLSIVCSLSRVD